MKDEKKAVFTAQVNQFVGPIPPPALIADYGKIDSSFPERIMTLAENETAHRHRMEEKALNADIEDMKAERVYQRIGQLFGLTIGLTAVIGGLITSVKGQPIAGSLIGVGGVAGLVKVFIVGWKDQTQVPRPKQPGPDIAEKNV